MKDDCFKLKANYSPKGALVLAPNKTLAAQLYGEMRE